MLSRAHNHTLDGHEKPENSVPVCLLQGVSPQVHRHTPAEQREWPTAVWRDPGNAPESLDQPTGQPEYGWTAGQPQHSPQGGSPVRLESPGQMGGRENSQQLGLLEAPGGEFLGGGMEPPSPPSSGQRQSVDLLSSMNSLSPIIPQSYFSPEGGSRNLQSPPQFSRYMPLPLGDAVCLILQKL